MAQHFTRASPYLQQTAKQLASRDTKGWSYPLWGYVVGCIGVVCVCFFNGFITSLIEKRVRRKIAEKGDLENGVVVGVPIDGTNPDSMAKEQNMTNTDTATLTTLGSRKNASFPTKMKRAFNGFGKGKRHDDAASVTVVNTSATNTTARNSVGSHPRGDVSKEDLKQAYELDSVAVSRPDAVAASEGGSPNKAGDDQIEFVRR